MTGRVFEWMPVPNPIGIVRAKNPQVFSKQGKSCFLIFIVVICGYHGPIFQEYPQFNLVMAFRDNRNAHHEVGLGASLLYLAGKIFGAYSSHSSSSSVSFNSVTAESQSQLSLSTS